MDVTVLVCTYNGALRLPATVDHLIAQQTSLAWEVVIVNNASTDYTPVVARTQADRFSLAVPCTVLDEPRAGKANALELGFSRALGTYVIICDDDNWLAPDYLSTAFRIMESQPEAGALGGWGKAVFEGEEPDWFARYQSAYAVGLPDVDNGDVTESLGVLPGAGMVLRRSALQRLYRAGFTFTDRVRGDDTEICLALRLAGYRIWFDRRLHYEHHMPAGRLTWMNFLGLTAINGQITPYWTAYSEILEGKFSKQQPSSWYWVRKVLPSLVNGHLARVLWGMLTLRARGKRTSDRYRSLIYQWNVWLAYLILRKRLASNIQRTLRLLQALEQ